MSRPKWAARTTLGVLLLSMSWIGSAKPTTAQPESHLSERATGFEAAERPGEELPGGRITLGIYAVLWLLVLGYVSGLIRAHGQNEQRIEQLEHMLERLPPVTGHRA